MRIALWFSFVLVVGSLIGCGQRTVTVETPDGKKVTVTQGAGGGEATVKGADGLDMKVTTSAGGGVKIPDDFPKDVPVYPGAKVKTAASVQGNRTLSLETADAVDKAQAFYADKLKAEGWNVLATTNVPNGVNIGAQKDKSTLGVAISKQGDQTAIVVTVTTMP